MNPIEDLGQFKALAETLPAVAFNAAGAVHPRISLFAATASDADIQTISGAVDFLQVDADLAAAIARADADLRLYELDLHNPSLCLGEVNAARTIAYGMMAIEPGPDLFALASLSAGPEAIATDDPIAALTDGCSRDVCALLGALMAARMAALPVLIDGFAALHALRLLQTWNAAAISHCAVPLGSVIEDQAHAMGLTIMRCNDSRPLYALADAILHAKAPQIKIEMIS